MLELGHAARHDPHAAHECGALPLGKPLRDPQHPRGIGHELAFGGQHAVGQERRELLGKWGGRLLAGDDPDESLGKLALFTSRKGWLILDSVGDAAQQIRIAHNIAQARGKLRNGERERARDILQDRVLPRQIGGMFVSRHG